MSICWSLAWIRTCFCRSTGRNKGLIFSGCLKKMWCFKMIISRRPSLFISSQLGISFQTPPADPIECNLAKMCVCCSTHLFIIGLLLMLPPPRSRPTKNTVYILMCEWMSFTNIWAHLFWDYLFINICHRRSPLAGFLSPKFHACIRTFCWNTREDN